MTCSQLRKQLHIIYDRSARNLSCRSCCASSHLQEMSKGLAIAESLCSAAQKLAVTSLCLDLAGHLVENISAGGRARRWLIRLPMPPILKDFNG